MSILSNIFGHANTVIPAADVPVAVPPVVEVPVVAPVAVEVPVVAPVVPVIVPDVLASDAKAVEETAPAVDATAVEVDPTVVDEPAADEVPVDSQGAPDGTFLEEILTGGGILDSIADVFHSIHPDEVPDDVETSGVGSQRREKWKNDAFNSKG
jgi:hypothetical protein